MKDKKVVITGATSGLGRATALQLAQKEAFVIIIARSKTKVFIQKLGYQIIFFIQSLAFSANTLLCLSL